jgi:hypothetical protein
MQLREEDEEDDWGDEPDAATLNAVPQNIATPPWKRTGDTF